MRLFIALWPDSEVRRLITAIDGVEGARVRAENVHLTLAFLGEQPASLVPPLLRVLDAMTWPGATCCIDRLGHFGKQHDYTLWAGPHDVPPALEDLYRQVCAALKLHKVVWTPTKRFVPHVTLARHAPAPWPRTLKSPSINWVLGQPVLVHSQNSTAGPRYHIVAR